MPSRPLLFESLAAVVLTAASLSCGGTVPQSRAVGASGPAYAGYLTTLFDDGIDAQAVGASLEPTSSPQEDDLLRVRTQVGDCVARVRVVSVTSMRNDLGPSWQLGLHVLERLAGCGHVDDFTLEVKAGGPAAGVMRVFDGRLIGVPFLAFVRNFSSPNASETEQHFHLSAQGKVEMDAARVAALFSR
jgi:hypothetical protein